MKSWKELTPSQLEAHPFSIFNDDWALITAEAEGKVNSMTISWGGLGTLCGRPVVTVYVRDSRYTYGLLEATQRFSVSALPETYRSALDYLGSASGRNEDKIAGSGLTLIRENDTPAFAEARLILLCKKFYSQGMDITGFTDQAVPQRVYSKALDVHKIFIGEVERILVKD